MPSAADLRAQIERRWHGAATHAKSLEDERGRPTGVAELDALLGPGGLPAGKLTEIFGAASSGKTAVAFAALAACTREGHLGAYVDPQRTFFAPAAAGAGIELCRCMVVQPKDPAGWLRAADALARGGACTVVAVDCKGMAQALQSHHCARLVAQGGADWNHAHRALVRRRAGVGVLRVAALAGARPDPVVAGRRRRRRAAGRLRCAHLRRQIARLGAGLQRHRARRSAGRRRQLESQPQS